MPFHKFEDTDVFYNRVETHPQTNLIVYNGNLYLNNKSNDSGSFVNNAGMVPTGYVNLYELNVDRQAGDKIYPFVTKDGSLYSFSTISTRTFNTDFLYGDQITGSYPMSASISSDRYAVGQSRPRISALRTSLNSYKVLSPSYAYSSSHGDKSNQELRLISIPSIFYGSSIQKGSVSCKFYVSGTLISELRDDMKNGQLKQAKSLIGTVSSPYLYAHYKFDESLSDGDWRAGDGDTLLDSSGNGYNATPNPVGAEIQQVEGKFISGALGYIDGGGDGYSFEYSGMSMTGSTGASGGLTVTCWLSKSYDPNGS